MKLVKVQCTNCNANLEIDDLKEKAICPFCNTEYILEEAINNYAVNTNSINIQNANIITRVSLKKEKFEIDDGILIRYNGEDETVDIPKNVSIIETGAFFKNNKIKNVIIHEDVE